MTARENGSFEVINRRFMITTDYDYDCLRVAGRLFGLAGIFQRKKGEPAGTFSGHSVQYSRRFLPLVDFRRATFLN